MLPGCRTERWIRTVNRERCLKSSGRLPLIVAFMCCFAFDVSEGYPLKTRPSTYESEAVDFLTKFGYLPQSDLATGNLRTEYQLKEAIKLMQRFGNIPQTGVIDDATLALMRRKRCGVPDIIGISERVKRYTLQGQVWTKVNLTWSMKRPVPISEHMARGQFDKAFKVWSRESRLSFREVSGTDSDIIISFYKGNHNDGYSFDGKGSILAHAFFPGGGIGGDAHFDLDETWISTMPGPGVDGINLFIVAVHEFGHSLGLSHSIVPGALMYPYYQDFELDFRLPFDDRAGIQQMYGLLRRWEGGY